VVEWLAGEIDPAVYKHALYIVAEMKEYMW